MTTPQEAFIRDLLSAGKPVRLAVNTTASGVRAPRSTVERWGECMFLDLSPLHQQCLTPPGIVWPESFAAGFLAPSLFPWDAVWGVYGPHEDEILIVAWLVPSSVANAKLPNLPQKVADVKVPRPRTTKLRVIRGGKK